MISTGLHDRPIRNVPPPAEARAEPESVVYVD